MGLLGVLYGCLFSERFVLTRFLYNRIRGKFSSSLRVPPRAGMAFRRRLDLHCAERPSLLQGFRACVGFIMLLSGAVVLGFRMQGFYTDPRCLIRVPKP